MLTRRLQRLARFALRRPKAVLVGALLPALLGLAALRTPLDLSFAGVMDREHPEVARYFAASERHGLGRVLAALLEGPEARLDEAVLRLRLALDELEPVASVSTGPPHDWLRARAPFLVPPQLFEQWLALAEDEPDPRSSAALVAALEDFERELLPPRLAGTRLVRVELRGDAFETGLDGRSFPSVRRAARDALEPLGVEVRFAGMHAIIGEEREATLERLGMLAPVSLLLVLLLLRLVEPRLLGLAAAAFPMLLSVGATLGLIGAVSGRLTLMESVFGVLVFGLGVDAAIHLLMRLREERARGASLAEGVLRAVSGTGRGILASGATTGGAFLLLTASPDPVFQRLGAAGGLGLLLCVAFLLLGLPAGWALLERVPSRGGDPDGAAGGERPRRAQAAVGALAGRALRAPGRTLAAGALVVLVAALGLPELRYETDLERVFSREIVAPRVSERVHALYGVDPAPWLASASSLEECRRLERAFEADPLFTRTESVARLFPPDTTTRVRRLAELAPRLADRLRRESSAARQRRAAPAWQGERRRLLDALLRAEALGPPRLDALPSALDERLVGPEGELLVYAYVAQPALDSAVAARERRAARAVAPDATSIRAVPEALIGTERPWMPPVTAAVLAFVTLVLWIDLRSLRLALVALIPVAAAGLVGAGLLGALGFAFNTVTLVGIPLLLGLGVDDGIHMIHRMLEEPTTPLERIAGEVGVPILLTTLTTCASVATLLLSRHPGLESLAVVLLIGLPLCLLASITLLPAAATLLGAPALARSRAAADARARSAEGQEQTTRRLG